MDVPRTLAERMLAGGARPALAAQVTETAAAVSESLISKENTLHDIDTSVRLIDLDLIDIETQIRSTFDENHVADLALDFISSGLMQPKQPVTVYRRDNGRYLLDAGENRLRAMRYADAKRDGLGITDPAAFKRIRATILGDEPCKLDRLQSQARENLLRADLNDVDLANAVKQFMEANPKASQTDAAKWVGFINIASGRVRVNNALKLLTCDDDLIAGVRRGEIAASRALVMQAERNSRDCNDPMKPKHKTDKKPAALPVALDSLKLVSEILLAIAAPLGIELKAGQGELDCKGITALLNAPALRELLGRVKA